jgi:hypothetical protein
MKPCILISVSLLFLHLACINRHPTDSASEAPGLLELTVKLGDVGSLAKQKTIDLNTLTLILAAPGEDTIFSKTLLNGNTRQTITKTFADMASIKKWDVTAIATDKDGATIHSGTTTFVINPRDTAIVTLELAAKYSMLKANFFPIRDSVNACLLIVDGSVVADSSFKWTELRGDSVKLSFDYLTASPEGIEHTIRLDVRGIVWGDDTLLYRGDTVITVISGARHCLCTNTQIHDQECSSWNYDHDGSTRNGW